jgi:hypothetical protein
MRASNSQDQFEAAEVTQVLHGLLHDTAVSGMRRRRADALTAPVVSELVFREWMDWDDERLVLTESGRKGLILLKLEVAGSSAGVRGTRA